MSTRVIVELPLSGPGGRSYAFIIDWHIRLLAALLWLLVGLLITALLTAGASRPRIAQMLVFWPPALIYFLYHPIVELMMGGQTPGKRMAGVRVVTRTGQPPSVRAILIRNVFRLIDSLPAFYTVGLLSTIVTRDSVRLGDLAAGTVLANVSFNSGTRSARQSIAPSDAGFGGSG